MTEQGAGATGENRAQTSPVRWNPGATDRIDAAMEPVEAPCAKRPVDGALRIAQRPRELADRDNAVLRIREASELMMRGRQSFFPHSGHKVCRTKSLPGSR
jgi:hypothetical protein